MIKMPETNTYMVVRSTTPLFGSQSQAKICSVLRDHQISPRKITRNGDDVIMNSYIYNIIS